MLLVAGMSSARLLLVAIVVMSAARTAAAEERPRAQTGHVLPEPDPTAKPVVSAGAGVDSFIGKALREAVGPGVSWSVRASIGSPSDIRVELVYAGSSQALTGAGMEGGRLVGHGVHGLLRANVAPNAAFEPFLYIGGGWSRYHATGAATGDLRSPDHVLEIPFGFGAARRFGRFVLDARAGLSILSGADLVPQKDPLSAEGQTMHRAGLRVSFGVEL